jgi:hypothetical protein
MAFERKLKLPDNIDKYRKTRFIWVDKEIAEVIQYLWKHGIDTRGCCSGHDKEYPSVVISSGYNSAEVLEIRRLINEVDGRPWIIYQWKSINDKEERLTEV